MLGLATRIKKEGSQPTGWIREKDKIIVIEQNDTFGRREFDWVDVSSNLIDDNASVGGRIVLDRPDLDDFLVRNPNGRRNGLLGTLLDRG